MQYNILFRGSMSEPFKKISSISDVYEYSNIEIKSSSYIIHIFAISGVRIYSDLRSVNMWHPKIIGYLFST